jgi:hypothetical protein
MPLIDMPVVSASLSPVVVNTTPLNVSIKETASFAPIKSNENTSSIQPIQKGWPISKKSDQRVNTEEVLSLKEIIKDEYKKCALDPIYFIKKYIKIQSQTLGIIPFELYDFQETALKTIHENNRIVILKSRQMGISTLVAAYALWLMIFNSGKNVLAISIKQESAKEIISKVRVANENLPSWLKIKTIEDNRLSIKFKNKSMILATSSASDASRGYSASLIICDEAAFVENIEALWVSAQQTLSTVVDGKAIILSTPNGIGNFFHKVWADSESKKSGFKPIKLPWQLHPKRDDFWREQQTKELGDKLASQECDCSFLSSGTNVIALSILDVYEKNYIKEPIEYRAADELWIFEPPNYSKGYIIAADTARGDGSDYSAAQVIDTETSEQVAEYKAQIGTTEFGNLLVNLATEYNDALLIIERENVGWATIQTVINRQYKNLFYSSKDLKYVDVLHQLKNKYNKDELIPGFSTNVNSRPLLISKLEGYFRERAIIIRSVRTLNELKTFIWEKHKAQAMQGYNDDLILALCLTLWVRDTALRLKQEGISLIKTMINKMDKSKFDKKHTSIYTPNRIGTPEYEQWNMKTGRTNEKESLTWLLK